MALLRVNSLVSDPVLVTRDSARALAGMVQAALAEAPSRPSGVPWITIDFAGIDGVSPSFLDELLRVLHALLRPDVGGERGAIAVAHPPARLSTKFQAIARSHGLLATALADGSWVLAPAT